MTLAIMRCLPLLALPGLIWVSAGSARAQLTASSPFVSPQVAAAASAAQPVPLEFAGYVSMADGMKYVVRDPSRKISSFLRLNESDPNLGVVVKHYDTSEDTLTVEYQGKPLTLEVRKARIVSSGRPALAMPAAMPVPVATNMSPAVTQSVVVNPTAADEQKRLEAVTAEVERRRQLREQAQPPQGVAAPVAR